MINFKKRLTVFTILLVVSTSLVGAKMALDLKASCNAKVEVGQTCTDCIKVEDMIKELGL